MAQIPIFSFNGVSFEAPLVKLNRDKVYGWVETRYTDSNNQLCNFVTLLDDGRTMVDQGGIALKSIDEKGEEIDKSTLVAKLDDGSEAPLIPSVFDKENVLSTEKGIDDFLLLDVNSVYQLNITNNKDAILELLKEHLVLYFPFNYRSGYDPNDAFLIAQQDNLFVITGNINDFSYSKLDLPTVLEDDGDEAGEEIDFNMF